MKVLIINGSLHGGSTGKIASCMYEMLKSNGHQVRFLYGDFPEKADNDDQICVSTKTEQFIHKVYNCVTGYNSTFAPLAMSRIEKHIIEFRPDIIQLYNLHGYYLDIYKLFKLIKKYDIPTVYGMIDEHPYLGYCTYAYDCDQFKTGCKNCELKIKHGYMNFWVHNKGRQTFLKKQKAYNSIENIAYTGPEWVTLRARESALMHDKRLEIIDEFIDTEKTFYPRDTRALRQELGISEDKIVVLNVARSDDRRKGVDSYIECAKLCQDERYVFMNIGFLGDRSVLPANYIPLDLEYNQDRLAQYYSLADILVCTSFADTMPNVCLDALACGTPVIGYDITGTPYVADEPLGRFVKAGDARALLKAIETDGKKSEETSKACREYALSRYSPQVYYDKSMKLYKDLIKN